MPAAGCSVYSNWHVAETLRGRMMRETGLSVRQVSPIYCKLHLACEVAG